MVFGEKVRQTRESKNITRKELAERAGVAERSIYSYEMLGAMPRQDILRKLAATLQVSVSYLINNEETDPQRDIDRELFISEVRGEYGSRGVRQAQVAMDQLAALYAGGELDENAKDEFFRLFTEIYMASKTQSKEKFTPKSRRLRIKKDQ